MIDSDEWAILMTKAVALKYSRALPAPFVVAKGAGDLANRLTRIARDHGVQVLEGEELADRLFEFEIGTWIPEELFEVVAHILAYVYKAQAAQ